ncbi:hypothetical protein J2W40_003235 [Sphingobium xenophagum]|uniref:PH domain-containing protein n=1 Tax=Sphingobium xenophagum TaxID=121428 RepID=A0ABU1X485_SPHXE|nr:STM3941 family protein [Sphingobium xenophagum]MDR7156394.1 hypothetical protein [Sphingobium xenophagum]
MGDFIAYPSKWRIALLAHLSAGFVVIGLWMIGFFGPIPSSRRYSAIMVFVMGWVCTAFFGFCAVAVVTRLFTSGEDLRIGPTGIKVRSWSDQTIPWSEIADVTTWKDKSIILHLRNPSLFPGRGAGAMMTRFNRMITGGHVDVMLAGSDRSFDEAMDAITQFRC